MKLYFEAYGCTLNMGESRILQDIISDAGHTVVHTVEDSDAVVLSTCTVIERTERDMLKRITTLAEEGKPLFVSGCMADIEGQKEKIRAVAPDVMFVSTKDLAGILCFIDFRAPPVDDPINDPEAVRASGQSLSPSRDDIISIIPVCTGCLGRCTYCITRYARGPVSSRAVDEIVRDVACRVSSGPREVRLTSQDMAVYGTDIGASLPGLLKEVCPLDRDFRVRVGMLNPGHALDMLPELIDAFASLKVFKFLHLPVQSGSPAILEAMGRDYMPEDFLAIVDGFRAAYPGFTLSTDIIVGFPGEMESDFERTLALIRRSMPDKVNITRFSARPGTPAAVMEGQVVSRIAKDRSRVLTGLCEGLSLDRNEGFVGKVENVFVTERGRDGSVLGRTPDYRLVVLKAALPLGSFRNVRIVEAKPYYLVGEPE